MLVLSMVLLLTFMSSSTAFDVDTLDSNQIILEDSFSYGMQDLIPDLGLNLGPLHWECGVLDTGQPGKS